MAADAVDIAEEVENMLVLAGLGKEIDWEDAEDSADVLAALHKCLLVQHRGASQGRCQAAVDFCGVEWHLQDAVRNGLVLDEVLTILSRCADLLGEMDCSPEWRGARIVLGMLSGRTRAEVEGELDEEAP